MNKFNKLFNKIITELSIISNQTLKQEKEQYFNLQQQNNNTNCYCFIEDTIICEDVYFQKWDVNESCIQLILKIIDQIKKNYQETHDLENLELKISIKDFLSQIDYSTLSNYKNFHKFLDILKTNAKGYITISIGKILGDNSSFYLPPQKFQFINEKNFIGETYFKYIDNLTKNVPTYIEKLKIIMQEICTLQNFGTINISSEYFRRDEKFLKIAIGHELIHFFKFLIKINSLNFIYGLYFSQKNLDYTKLENYFLKPDQWKELAGTYIEELCIIFENISIEHNWINAQKFLYTFFWLNNLPFYLNIQFNINELKLFIKSLENHFHKNEIGLFFQATLNASKSKELIRNNWKILIKWLNNEFKKRFKFSK